MTQEEKSLLLQDLCARLPYEVNIQVKEWTVLDTELKIGHINRLQNDDIELKPYLRPMSSMTEEEKRQYGELCDEDIRQLTSVQIVHPGLKYKTSCHRSIDWLNKNMFDYRRLIEKGLALSAHVGMYKTVV